MTDITAKTVPFTQEDVMAYLDACIRVWRDRRSHNHEEARFYIDAYQSVRSSLFGELLP